MGVSKNKGTPKWLVYNGKSMKTLLKWMLWGVPLFMETPVYVALICMCCNTCKNPLAKGLWLAMSDLLEISPGETRGSLA